ncbi:MAG: DUF1624 domain-containing protein [Bacilli bacterium]|nr:DUF1624 domain-containing protein [Bacilli bacterium]
MALGKAKKPYGYLPSRFYKKKERIFEIDLVRGLAVFLMIALHACFCLGEINKMGFFVPPDQPVPWIENAALFGYTVFALIDYGQCFFLEFFFSSMFMFLAGVSTSFSRNNWDRSLKLALFSTVMVVSIEIVSNIFNLGFHIYVGILQSMSIALLLYALVDTFFKSYWVDFGIGIVFSVLYLLSVAKFGETLNWGWLTSLNTTKYPMPLNLWRLVLGLNHLGDDYFSPLLTCLMVFFGATVGKTIYAKKRSLLPASLPKKWAAPLVWMSNNSLLIYVLHTPVIYLILFLICLPFGYRFKF